MKVSGHIAAAMDTTMNMRSLAGNGLCRVSNLRGFTSGGAEIAVEWDDTTGMAKFASVPSKITYVYDTGFEDVKMDVTVTDCPNGGGSSAPGGGCDVGFGFAALAFVLPALLKKRMQ